MMYSDQGSGRAASVKDVLAFVSFSVPENETSRAQFVAEIGACKTPLSINYCSQVRQAPHAEWQKQLQDRIGRADLMIILVGKDTAKAANVTNEITTAKSRNVPFFGVYIDGADGNSDLPEGLPRNRTIPWDWDRLASAVTQLMHEGKHHQFV